jgi:hypothetical protein
MPNGSPGGGVTTSMNLRIAQLLKEAEPAEITEILAGPEPSLLRLTQQQQQQQQQKERASYFGIASLVGDG